MSQGYDNDNSGCEWEEHITQEYGEVARRERMIVRDSTIVGIDVVEVLQQTFGTWNELRNSGAVATEALERKHDRNNGLIPALMVIAQGIEGRIIILKM